MWLHSAEENTRGMTSNGHARSMLPAPSLYRLNVMPDVEISISAARCRLCRSSSDSPPMWRTSSRAASLGDPLGVINSSYRPWASYP
jgi:hypothetical protein